MDEIYASLKNNLEIRQLDWELRFILADYCEENNKEQEASFWRWVAKEQKTPRFSQLTEIWDWWVLAEVYESPDRYSMISEKLWNLLQYETIKHVGKWKGFVKFLSAYDNLYQAWCKLNG